MDEEIRRQLFHDITCKTLDYLKSIETTLVNYKVEPNIKLLRLFYGYLAEILGNIDKQIGGRGIRDMECIDDKVLSDCPENKKKPDYGCKDCSGFLYCNTFLNTKEGRIIIQAFER